MTTTVGDEEAATTAEGGDVSAARPVSVANQTQCCGKLKVALIAVGSKHVIYKKMRPRTMLSCGLDLL